MFQSKSGASPNAALPFSSQIRTSITQHHADAQDSTFMSNLLGGRLEVSAYYRYSGQLWHIYRALEAHWDTLARDPVAGPFMRPELARLDQLETDLAYLGGTGWREDLTALASTEAYAARIEECARAWPAGYVAHHYARYMGDLAGGQVIRHAAEKFWQLPKRGDGVQFYVFDKIPNTAAFKREYRARLNELPIGAPEKHSVLREAQRASDLNIAMFQELSMDFPARQHEPSNSTDSTFGHFARDADEDGWRSEPDRHPATVRSQIHRTSFV
jgi:heme oxygenase (biliverdin-producing, ferredoxin)